jgi:hypothetical protein
LRIQCGETAPPRAPFPGRTVDPGYLIHLPTTSAEISSSSPPPSSP